MVRLKSFLGIFLSDGPRLLTGNNGCCILVFTPKNMDTQFLETIRENLLDKKGQLKQEIEDLTGQSEPSDGEYQLTPPDYGSDEDENSAEVAAFTTDLSVKGVLEASLRDVLAAIERLEAGAYGVCKYCGQPIDERRLLARPVSGSCVNCKESMKRRT